jgi:hypothetical protein
MVGTTRTATRVAIAAAVLRSSQPNAEPRIATTVRYSATPVTARSTPGSVRHTVMPAVARTVCAAKKNAVSVAVSVTAKVTAARARALPATSRPRWGTAVSVGLIMPVAYSLVTASTPSVAIA